MTASDGLRDAIAEVLDGWHVDSGFKGVTVGYADALRMAAVVLATPEIEWAIRIAADHIGRFEAFMAIDLDPTRLASAVSRSHELLLACPPDVRAQILKQGETT